MNYDEFCMSGSYLGTPCLSVHLNQMYSFINQHRIMVDMICSREKLKIKSNNDYFDKEDDCR